MPSDEATINIITFYAESHYALDKKFSVVFRLFVSITMTSKIDYYFRVNKQSNVLWGGRLD